ncbi:hypothetical protein Cantr_06734 [Candida viswanathii]|uniref:Uncharacterized protein n=1 Tax=Candida viswanathii TaxID=5486 RepID=A0A367XUS0_9ASCO|nr:hypothetical protein Cantr_06734 [Candida viswanathii]
MNTPIDEVINSNELDEAIKPPQLQPPEQEIDVGSDIPLLQKLINEQPNADQLTQELKNALLKYYWSGFDLGYETQKSSN